MATGEVALIRRGIMLLALAAAMLMPFESSAQAPRQRPGAPGPVFVPTPLPSITVREVQVEGAQRIDPETVRSYAGVRAGDQIDSDKVDQALRTLFATGLFQDVNVTIQGANVVIRVVENPIINRIQFEGNRRVSDEVLNGETQLRARHVYTRTRVQNDVRRILEVYRRSGRFAATVEPKVIQLPENRVDLVFEIQEGATTGVSRITFVGNQNFSENRLKEAIRTRESRWYRLLSIDDNYDPDRVAFDRELLRRFYLSQGYADFRVVSSVAELSPDRTGFFITFTVEEGERYKFGTINVVSQIRTLNADDLRTRVISTEGDWYNADQVEATVNALTEAAGDLGFAFVEIRPRVERNRDEKTISITYEIQEGPRVYVDRINIVGNVRTLDRVVRREMRLAEGDAFNTSKLRRSRQRIRNLGFFERVEVTNVPADAPDRTTVNVEVQERSTGELSFGVGFSTADGLLGDVSVRERNFLGRGQDLRLAFTIAQRRQQIDLSFTEPYFLDRNIVAGFDIFRVERDFKNQSDYKSRSTGFGLRMGYALTEFLSQNLRYRLSYDEIFDVGTNASPIIVAQPGQTLTSLIGTDLVYDRRDDRLDPTSGYFIRTSFDFAGVGGDSRFIRTRLAGGYYYPFWEGWVGSVTGELGYIRGLGQDVLIQNRYFVGGDNLRGFATSGIGPRDAISGNALGGNRYATTSLEVQFPTPVPPEFGIRGLVFADVGWLNTLDGQMAGVVVNDSNAIRLSIGAGLNWRSPFGPVRVSVGRALLKEPFDRTETFRFGFGSRF